MKPCPLNPVYTGLIELNSPTRHRFDEAFALSAQGIPVAPELDWDRLTALIEKTGFWNPAASCFQEAMGPLLHLNPRDPQQRKQAIQIAGGRGERFDISNFEPFRKHRLHVRVLHFGDVPTQSFKYFGLAQTMATCLASEVKRIVIHTQGNAGAAALECFLHAWRPDVELHVLLPDSTPEPIKGRICMLAALYPNVTARVESGNISVLGGIVAREYIGKNEGWVSLGTGIEPFGCRRIGKSYMTFFSAERSDGSWRLPDYWFYPAGGGTGPCGFSFAREVLERLEKIDSGKQCRVVLMQSEQNQPLVDAFEASAAETTNNRLGDTILTGVDVSGGAKLHRETLRVCRESGGFPVAVSDKAAIRACRDLRLELGVQLGMEASATVAALLRALEAGQLDAGSEVDIVSTGSDRNYNLAPETIRRLLSDM